MPLIPVIAPVLLALSVNVDSFAVAVAYGIKRLRIGFSANLFIALVSALGTFLSISVGAEFSQALPIATARDIGSFVLIGGGSWGIWQALHRQRKRRRSAKLFPPLAASSGETSTRHETSSFAAGSPPRAADAAPFQEFLHEFSYERFLDAPEQADRDHSGSIDVRESIALAFGLSLNNLTVGVGAGVAGFPTALTTLLTFLLAVLAMTLGYQLGRQSRIKSGRWAGLLSSLLILLTGLYEYVRP